MTSAGIATMRIAATLAHALPVLRVRVRHHGATLLHVTAHPAGSAGVAIGACAFRRAVARAHEQCKRGHRLAFIGVPPDEGPTVDIRVRRGDAALPGGVYRVALGPETIHGFGTTLPLRHCRRVLEGLPEIGHVVRLYHDTATEVTLVHTVTPTADAPADAAHLTPALEALLVDELVHEVLGAGGA